MRSIYDAIKADHDHHRALLARIDKTEGASEERRAAWDEFFHDVKAHAAAEEEEFYSKLMQQTWGQDSARHSVEEHGALDDIMEELHEMDMSSPGWIQRFRTLKHDYEHHMEEEEDEVFARARKVIDDSETEGYGKVFDKRKAEELKLVEKKREDALED
ncbi:hemerythrin domain-containing protein [Mesobacterium pallidum]|uniref:hemerythrin domain-containing protein n=1 Tax=Mesobacterium pallidum TaxID=2872037 RepID=UPI001EE35970|nr:hemerythrin domain-containing protein [Mesobacterium pallidum]